MNWGFRKDAEVVSNIVDRAMREGSAPVSEDEGEAVIRWAIEYKKRFDEKKDKEKAMEQSKLRIVDDD